MQNVEFEMVPVSNSDANTLTDDEQSQSSSSDGATQARNVRNVMESSRNLKMATARALRDGYFPVVLGGDHSMGIGSVAGCKSVHPDSKIIWMDAHIDANTPESSPSGNIHGMPLAYL
jgi:arginase